MPDPSPSVFPGPWLVFQKKKNQRVSHLADLGNFSTRPVTFREGLKVFPDADASVVSSGMQPCESARIHGSRLHAAAHARIRHLGFRSLFVARPRHCVSHDFSLLGPPEGARST